MSESFYLIVGVIICLSVDRILRRYFLPPEEVFVLIEEQFKEYSLHLNNITLKNNADSNFIKTLNFIKKRKKLIILIDNLILDAVFFFGVIFYATFIVEKNSEHLILAVTFYSIYVLIFILESKFIMLIKVKYLFNILPND